MLPVYKMNYLPISAYISILLYDKKNTVDVIYTTNTRHQKWNVWKRNSYL